MPNRPEHQRNFESPHSSHKGVARVIRTAKRAEAESRQEAFRNRAKDLDRPVTME